jgi:hypothetical protein
MNKEVIKKPRKPRAKKEPVNHYTEFGKYILNMRQLLEKNKLLIKYKSMAPVPEIRGIKVSDDFVSLINDIVDTNKINIQTQKKLSSVEMDLLEKLLKICKLKDKLHYHRVSMDIPDIMHRFEILRGGILAGNHSAELIEEIVNVISFLTIPSVNKIEKVDANEMISYLKNIE